MPRANKEEAAKYGSDFYAACRAAGKCTACARPATKARCDECSTKDSERAKARRLRLVTAGMCSRCGVLPVFGGTTFCETHLAAARVVSKRYAASVRGKERVKERTKFYNRGSGRFSTAKAQAKRRQKEWSLAEPEWRAIISGPCHYCGLSNSTVTGSGLDRLDNSLGYLITNVVSCCWLCNRTRGSTFTPEHMREFGALIRKWKLLGQVK